MRCHLDSATWTRSGGSIPVTRAAKRGAVIGVVVGFVALVGVLQVTVVCLPFKISAPLLPFPWYCSSPVYDIIGFLAFPVTALTRDLSRAIFFAPIALLVYGILGALAASTIDARVLH